MSAIALGQAALVDKLLCSTSICTNSLEVSGTLITPGYLIATGSQIAPVDLNGTNVLHNVGALNKVVLYAWSSVSPTINFQLRTSTAGVRNHSFIVTTAANQTGGTIRTLSSYSVIPLTTSTGTDTQFALTYIAAPAAADAQRITVYILTDA